MLPLRLEGFKGYIVTNVPSGHEDQMSGHIYDNQYESRKKNHITLNYSSFHTKVKRKVFLNSNLHPIHFGVKGFLFVS